MKALAGIGAGHKFKEVRQQIANNREDIDLMLAEALKNGREGVMVKALDGVYETKRSFAWQKLKPFRTDIMTIMDSECAKGLCPKTERKPPLANPLQVLGGWRD